MRIERHFEHRRRSAGCRRAGPGFESLPIGPAGFIEMHVRVDHTRKDRHERRVDFFERISTKV